MATKHRYLKWILLLGGMFIITAVLLIYWNYWLYSGFDPRTYGLEQQVDMARWSNFPSPTTTIPASSSSSIYYNQFPTNFGILMYHRITDDPKNRYGRWAVKPEMFEQQVRFLLDSGYHFIKLNDAITGFVSASTTTDTPYSHTLVLTFDDGYRNFYTVVYPLLQQLKIPATVFVITKDVGKNGNVTWDMLREMQASGFVEIGAHTISHKYLTKLPRDAAWEELSGSKEIIEKQVGATVNTLAYPYGYANFDIYKMAAEAGYVGAVRTMSGERPAAKNLFAWRRTAIDNADIGLVLLRKIYTAFEVIK